MVSNGYKIAGIAALACLLGFFLPWIAVGLFGVGLTVSGWQASFGYSIGGYNMGGGNILFVLVALAPFGVGYLLFNSFKKGGALDRKTDAYGLMGIGGLVTLLLLWASSGIGMLGTSLGFGWILCLLSALALVGAGYLNLKQLAKLI